MFNQNIYNKKYYLTHSTKRKQRIYERQKEIKDKIQSIKLELGCKICGYNKCARALQFHHNDSNQAKNGNIAKWVAQGRCIKTILEEISKCICVCANCHHEIHDEEYNQEIGNIS